MSIIRARKVLYLDFDGVLHHGEVYWHPKRGIYIKEPGYVLFEWMHILEELLAPYPDVAIVLSTSWVRSKSFDFAKKQLSPALQQRVIGATFHKGHMRKELFSLLPRGVQILGDVGRRQPEFWLSIDDDDEDWPIEHRHHLVRTKPHLGLSDPNVQEAMRLMLKRSEVLATGAVAGPLMNIGRRIGIAKGKFVVPDGIDADAEQIYKRTQCLSNMNVPNNSTDAPVKVLIRRLVILANWGAVVSVVLFLAAMLLYWMDA